MAFEKVRESLVRVDELDAAASRAIREGGDPAKRRELALERARLIQDTCDLLLNDPAAVAISRNVAEIKREVVAALQEGWFGSGMSIASLLRYPGDQIGTPNALTRLLDRVENNQS